MESTLTAICDSLDNISIFLGLYMLTGTFFDDRNIKLSYVAEQYKVTCVATS